MAEPDLAVVPHLPQGPMKSHHQNCRSASGKGIKMNNLHCGKPKSRQSSSVCFLKSMNLRPATNKSSER
jgi:hypothetical protein